MSDDSDQESLHLDSLLNSPEDTNSSTEVDDLISKFSNLQSEQNREESLVFPQKPKRNKTKLHKFNMSTEVTLYQYTPTLSLLLDPISKFDGNPAEIQNFLDAAQTVLKTCLPQFHNFLYLQIMQRIIGGARTNIKEHPEIKDWQTLKNYLTNQYRPKKTFSRLLSELNSISQEKDESVPEYSNRVQKLVHHTKEAGRLEATLENSL